MNKNDKKPKNEKALKQKINANSQKKNELITKIAKTHNITLEEAELILNRILEINVNKNNKITPQQIKKQKTQTINTYKTNDETNKNKQNNNFLEKINSDDESEKPKNNQKTQNVDSIISEIVPNYNKQISVELENVSLTFDTEVEKVDTLKESFIRLVKRDVSKKMKVKALEDVTFKIYKGEKVGIIGYNGAGKSTLLSVITGIYPPDEGNVKTYGHISPLLSLGAGFDYNYSGRKNIYLNGAVLGYDREFLTKKENEIIEFSELGDFIDIPIKNYSSGMLAKLSFSIATAVNPDILIIDEILGVGDVNFQKKSRDKMRSLMDGGTTVLLVSHSIPQIRELCDKAIWIKNGKIKSIGEVNKVCDLYLKDAEKATKEQLANIQFR